MLQADKESINAVIAVIIIGVALFFAANYFHWFESENNRQNRIICEQLQAEGKIPNTKEDLSLCKSQMADVDHQLNPKTICRGESDTSQEYAECLDDFESGERLIPILGEE